VAVVIRTVVIALVSAIILICLALAARAQQPFVHILPPLEWDKPFTGPLTIDVAKDTKEVQRLCGGLPTPRVACSYSNGKWCRIIKVSDETLRKMGWNPLHIMRHEHAHCWGVWGNDHKGSRAISEADDIRWRRLYKEEDLYVRNSSSRSQALEEVWSPAFYR
jgi:hypothetical protein